MGRRLLPGFLVLAALLFDLSGSHGVALAFASWSILSIGFLIASVVPTARFAQPLAALILYPMVALSGLVLPD